MKTTTDLLWFAALIGITLLVLLWRMIRAEEGHGFMPISRDVAYILTSAFFGALSIAFFTFGFILLLLST